MKRKPKVRSAGRYKRPKQPTEEVISFAAKKNALSRKESRHDIVTGNRLAPRNSEPVEVIFDRLDKIYEEAMGPPMGHDEL